MQTIKIEEISIGDRQRQEFAPKALEELKSSIAKQGLLHAIVLTAGKELVAGERRLRAIIELHQEGTPVRFNNTTLEPDTIPYTDLGDVDEVELAEAEFAENVFRAALTWQEHTKALAKLHSLRLSNNPKQSVSQTAREVVAARGKGAVMTERLEIANAMILADHLNDPEVKRARNSREAIKVILDRNESKVKAMASAVANGTDKSHRLIHGDCLQEMKQLQPGSVDTILADPPYGMNADKMGKGEFHMYDDSPETGLAISKAIISEGFRVTKPKAILFLFCDVDHFVELRTFAAQQAWSCWRFPLVWRKGTDGHSPWGRAGFIRTTEFILFASKGQKELVYPGGPDVLDFKRTGRADRVHAAEKPVDLLRHLLRLSTLPGETVLDPTAGSGAILEAATLEKVKAIAIEKDEGAYNECVQRLEKTNSLVSPGATIEDLSA